VFPHHENEIAQSTCAHHGASMARYWVHNGLVHVDSEKMSKSVGNVLLIRELLARLAPETVRLGLLTAHYRQPLDWSEQLTADAKRKLDRMYGALRDAGISGVRADSPEVPPAPEVIAALEEDLNTPQAIAELFELVRATNRAADAGQRRALAETLRASAWMLGLLHQDPVAWFEAAQGDADPDALTEQAIEALLDQRERLRRERKFAEADAIRNELAARGIAIEDGAGGSRWRRA
jgi:cysteinyl-tRNA synthetase